MIRNWHPTNVLLLLYPSFNLHNIIIFVLLTNNTKKQRIIDLKPVKREKKEEVVIQGRKSELDSLLLVFSQLFHTNTVRTASATLNTSAKKNVGKRPIPISAITVAPIGSQ